MEVKGRPVKEKIKRIKKMSRFDGTGPAGYGPFSGRGMGFCGRRFGRQSRFLSPKNEMVALEEEERELERELETVREEKSALKGDLK